MNCEAANLRNELVHLLKLLSSGDKQLEYARNVAGAAVPKELLCMWFDDFYLPKSEPFRQSFTDQELAALESFNVYFEEQSARLPQQTTIQSWLETDAWQGIMRKAAETLTRLRT